MEPVEQTQLEVMLVVTTEKRAAQSLASITKMSKLPTHFESNKMLESLQSIEGRERERVTCKKCETEKYFLFYSITTIVYPFSSHLLKLGHWLAFECSKSWQSLKFNIIFSVFVSKFLIQFEIQHFPLRYWMWLPTFSTFTNIFQVLCISSSPN